MASVVSTNHDQRPASPWAKRFAPRDEPWAEGPDGVVHSCLAPIMPELDPRYYDDEDPSADPVMPMPSEVDLDRLFHSERVQQQSLRGPKTRQVGVLNTNTFMRRSGHTYEDDSMPGTPFTVNEGNWLPCFRRPRWYNLFEVPTPNTPAHMPPTVRDDSNVDNPRVWDDMRPSLELANRILQVMATEQHSFLDKLLFGHIEVEEDPDYVEEGGSNENDTKSTNSDFKEATRWSLRDGVHPPSREDQKYRLFCRSRPINERPPVSAFLQKLREASDVIMFSFLDEDDVKAGGMDGGRTWSAPDGTIIVCYLNQYLLRGRDRPTRTHAEKYMSHLAFADNILHEFFHALYFARWKGDVPMDPFMDDEPFSEIGFAGTGSLFGGALRCLPGDKGRHIFDHSDGRFNGLPLTLNLETWADQHDFGFSNVGRVTTVRGYLLPGEEGAHDSWTSWTIPAFWATMLFTQDFWGNVVPKHGSRAFKAPRTVGARTHVRRGEDRTYSMEVLDPINEIPELFGPLNKLKERFREREQQYETARPWYKSEYAQWQLSPWSWSLGRMMIENFAVYHAQQNFYKCVETAENLLWYVDKAQDRDQVVNNQIENWAPSYWIFRYIGWLMLASLPDNKEPATQLSTTDRLHGPSQVALKAPLSTQVPGLREELTYLPRVNWHEARPQVVLPEWQGAPPLEYSEKIRQEVIAAAQVPYHDDWAIATYAIYQEILDFRGKNPDKQIWAPWNFKIPPYRREPNWKIIVKGKGVPIRSNPRIWDPGFFPSPKVSAVKLPPFDLAAQRRVKNTYNWSASKFYAARSRKKSPFLKHKYFTVADAADNGWIVDPNPEDATTDVFDLEALLEVLDDGDLVVDDLTVCGPLGRHLRPGQDDIRASLRDPRTRFQVGKLFTKYRMADVSAYDGRDDTPAWVMCGDCVFDITEYQPKDEQHFAWLHSSAGTVLVTDTEEEKGYLRDVLEGLLKCQIGVLTSESEAQPCPGLTHILFTEAMLRGYDNPTDGVYTAIGEYVYKLTDYIDNHPGGAVAIQSVAGRDGTKAFLEHHSLELLLDDPEFIACRIGRLVDERDEGDIDEDEIALHGSIFNVSGLYTEDRALHQLLMEWYGSDATEILTEDKPEYGNLRNSLTRFFLDRKDCVVAKIRSPSSERALREVTAGDVAKHGEDNKHAIWVSVDDDVFDVTALVNHPSYFSGSRRLAASDAGGAISSQKTAAWLREDHGHRIVARLVEHRHDSVSTIHLDDSNDPERATKRRKVEKEGLEGEEVIRALQKPHRPGCVI